MRLLLDSGGHERRNNFVVILVLWALISWSCPQVMNHCSKSRSDPRLNMQLLHAKTAANVLYIGCPMSWQQPYPVTPFSTYSLCPNCGQGRGDRGPSDHTTTELRERSEPVGNLFEISLSNTFQGTCSCGELAAEFILTFLVLELAGPGLLFGADEAQSVVKSSYMCPDYIHYYSDTATC
jgi:hypothetical protein